MAIIRTISLASASVALVLAGTSPALARKADKMTYINGKDVGDAERELRRADFKHKDGRAGNYGYYYSYWWHDKDENCIVVESEGGRVMTVNDASRSDCKEGGISTGGAVAAVAGAVLIGALLAHKSDHHDDRKHHEDEDYERQYEIGYQHGLHNKSYQNYQRSDAYSNGYSAGTEQREHNTPHHHSGHGGNSDKVRFDDVKGMRGSSMETELQRRGFRNVDGFKSGSTAYTIWNRSSSDQCLQVTMADGRVYDIRDIGRHPKCS